MEITRAIEGFLLFKAGEGLSWRTIERYRYDLDKLTVFLAGRDCHLHQLTAQQIAEFLAHLRDGYTPRRQNGQAAPLSAQSLRNVWVALKSLAAWAERTLDAPNFMRLVPAPKVSPALVQPFTRAEVQALLGVIIPRRATRPRSGKLYLKALRDRALIVLLLDTGIRNAEACALHIGDANLRAGRLTVLGKGAKLRQVHLGVKARAALFIYLGERPDGDDPARPAFIGYSGCALTPGWLRAHLHALGLAAGVPDVHPHRFRHTFAVEYLRNGGDVFTLQLMLGHTTLKMVQHYARLAAVDVELAHARASPADHWLK
jgi:integrase/recombinase XerD